MYVYYMCICVDVWKCDDQVMSGEWWGEQIRLSDWIVSEWVLLSVHS